MPAHHFCHGGSLHCQVEHHVWPKKKSTFGKLYHQNGSKFCQFFFMSRYIYGIYYIVEEITKFKDLKKLNIPFLARMTHN